MAMPNSSPMQDDLSDILPQSSGGISPYLVLAAQKEAASGQPKPGGPVDQLGQAHLRAQMAKQAAPQVQAKPLGTASPTIGPPAPQGPSQASVDSAVANPLLQNAVTKAQASNIAPGFKSSQTDTDTDTAKKAVSTKVGFDPYQRQLQEAITEGYTPRISGYRPMQDVNGQAIIDPKTGKPVDDTTQPMYDISKEGLGEANPNSLFQLQKSGIEKLQDMAGKRAQQINGQPPRPADLSGLMMAADFLNKTNTFGNNYRNQQANAEMARQDQNKNEGEIYGDQMGIQKAQNDLYKDALSGTNAGLNGGNILSQIGNTMAMQNMQGYGGMGAHLPPTEQVQNAKLAQMASHDPAAQRADIALSSANQMQNLLAQNTSPADLMAKIQALRASGLNRVTNFEVQNFNGDQRATEQANSALEKLSYGDLSKLSVQEIQQAVRVLAASAQQVADNRRQFFHDTGIAMGASPDYVEQQWGKPSSPGAPVKNRSYSTPTNVKAPAAAQHTPPKMSMGAAGSADQAQAWAKAHLNDPTLARDGQPNSAHAAAILKGE